jgi:hypothetical protein
MNEKKNKDRASEPEAAEDYRNLPLFRDDWMDDLDKTLDELDYYIEAADRILGRKTEFDRSN